MGGVVIEGEGEAVAGVGDDFFDVLQVDEVTAVGAEEAAMGEAFFDFGEGEVGGDGPITGVEVGLALFGGDVEDVDGVDENDFVFELGGDFEGEVGVGFFVGGVVAVGVAAVLEVVDGLDEVGDPGRVADHHNYCCAVFADLLNKAGQHVN